jgi:hypothetical protein
VVGMVAVGGEGLFVLALDYDMFNPPFSMQFVLFQIVIGVGTWS